ncbi:hypothetical protein TNCV_3229751 [Trichonephila clavipes]|nr:hypothetical protein TNCV_3229751 [Trichonephila clavipes]
MRTNANILPCRAVPADENFLWNDIDEKISLKYSDKTSGHRLLRDLGAALRFPPTTIDKAWHRLEAAWNDLPVSCHPIPVRLDI